MSTLPDLPHAHAADAVAAQLRTTVHGLSSAEAAARLRHHGPNALARHQRRPAWLRLLLQFHNVLLYAMMAAAAVTAVMGHWIDTGVLLAAVVINALIGFVQEGRAESALDGIRNMLSPRATVLRDGRRVELDATEVVPGDVVLLASGDRVPADLRLRDLHECRIDESALTGESVPADKQPEPLAADAPLGDRSNMAYAGTVVVHGQASGVVVATGRHTELGRIDTMLASVKTVSTPLLRQIDRFGTWLAVIILVMAALTFVLGTVVRGLPAADMFMMVVALTASAIPEGLPALMTVTLALGVQRMARRQAIVRQLPAVEALGSVTVICSDKTGTLTRNEMTVQAVACAGRSYDVDGAGYEPRGAVRWGEQPAQLADDAALQRLGVAAALCNDAVLRQVDGAWRVEGDPTEGALRVLGFKLGVDDAAVEQWRRQGGIPFESENRFMATSHAAPDGSGWIFIKGAPERVIEMCAMQRDATGQQAPLDHEAWRRRAHALAAQGQRVLALAERPTDAPGHRLRADDLAGGCTLLGLVGMVDPPREEALQAVADCHRAGIRVKMITGDHVETARAIGERLGIGAGKPALTGAEVALMDHDTLRRRAQEVDVFARASPEHKLRLVSALQHEGEVVAMTGDGVNDAPALKRADVGVAMGCKGTEAAKEAAHVVLADDNFATIVRAVREGRAVYDNIKKFILFVLPTNGGEALVIIAAVLLQLTLPMTPAQVLWINLVTSSTLGVALAFEPAESGVMTRRPRPPSEPLLSGFFAWRVLMVSVLMMIGALGLFLWATSQGMDLPTARTLAVNAVVAAEMFYLLNSRSITGSVLSRAGLFGNPQVWMAIAACAVLQLLFTYLPALQAVFDTRPIGLTEWGLIGAVGLGVFVVAEAEKLLVRVWSEGRRGPTTVQAG